jgi:signal recognition particle subunit SRP54
VFDDLSSRLGRVFKRLKGEGTVRERHLDETLEELKNVLLQADVSHEVVESFSANVREKALGVEVIDSLSPGQQIVKIVRDELLSLLGGESRPLRLPQQKLGVIVLAGLQGQGKTTTAAKLARFLKERGKVPLLVSADFSRPAAREQLAILAGQVGVKISQPQVTNALDAVKAAMKEAAIRGYDALIVDTAGRLHVADELMAELRAIVKVTSPVEVLFVGDAMTGQDAVRSASAFAAAVPLTGIVLTKLDGDARGGAALSMARATGTPVRFAGIGEKPEDFEEFKPDRMVSRLLGMGDVLTLIERVEKVVDKKAAEDLGRRSRKGELNLDDFRDQLRQMKKLGSLEKVVDMMPGGAELKKQMGQMDQKWPVHAEAIICSMTKRERLHSKIVDASRKRRIAKGSGRPLAEVNRLLKSFKQACEMHGKLMAQGKGGRFKGLPFPGG